MTTMSERRAGHLHIRVYPGGPGLAVNVARVKMPRRDDGLQAVQRPAVPRVALQILAVDRLRLGRLPRREKGGAEQVAGGEEFVLRLVISELVLETDGAAKERDRPRFVPPRRGDPRLRPQGADFVERAGRILALRRVGGSRGDQLVERGDCRFRLR